MAIGDEKVTIRIDVKADTAAIDRVRQKLRQLCREADDCADTFDRYSKAVDDSSDSHKDLDTNASRTTQQLRKMGKEASGLSRILKTAYKFAFIAAGIETAALALALSSVNGLLATGRFFVKTYHVAMSALAKSAAAAGVALATVAAAQRQFIAAQATGRYGGSFAASSSGLRSLTGDARLASLGMKSLSGAFMAASKNARVTGATASALAGLADFAVASGDIEKGTAALATFISLIQKGGAGQKGVSEAAAQIGPEFEKAFKEVSRGGKATSEELMKVFASGDLARRAGLQGGFGAMQGSLVGQLKTFMTEVQVMFGDLGMQFIEPVQKAFTEITKIMKRTILQISPLLNDFAQGGLLDKVVNAIDKVAQFLVTLMRDYVPRTQNFFESMSNAWNKITGAFERFGKYLRQFSDASRIMNKFFGQLFGAIGGGLRENFEAFAQLLRDNKDDFNDFGESVANFIRSIFRLTGAIRESFMKALPAINSIINAVARLIDMIAGLITSLGGLGNLGSLAGLMLPLMAGLSFRAGGANPGRMAKGFGAMSGTQKLGLAGGTLAIGALGQTGSVGQDLTGMATYAALAAMIAPGPLKVPAAVAAAGYKGVDVLTDRTYREGIFGTGIGAKNKAVSAGTGATAGAAIGATVGSIIPGVGTVTGAIAGTIIGSIVGGISGWMKEGKYKNQAKKSARTFVDAYASRVDDALAGNDIKAARMAMADFEAEAKKMAETQVKSGTAYDEATKLWDQRSGQLTGTVKVMEGRFQALNNITGMTNQQIQNMANAAEINLGNSMLSLKDILEATGVAVERLGEDFENYLIDTFADDVMGIQKDVAKLNAPIVKDEIAQAFIDAYQSGTAGTAEFGQMIEGILTQNQLQFGTAGADLAILSMLGGIGEFGQGGAFLPGGVFGARGITPESFTPEQIGIYEDYLGRRSQSYATGAAENIVAQLAGMGQMPTNMTVEQLTSMLAGQDLASLINLSQRLAQGGTFSQETVVTPYGAMPGAAPLEEQLGALFEEFGMDLGKNIELEKTNDQKMLEGINKFYNGTGTFQNETTIFRDAVDKFATAVGYVDGDTSSPRRNIVDTLGAHSRFDAMIAGNRTVTSGFRTYGLGSMSSDHAAGRAYDLVGQNLGLYQAAVRAGGGYAEFHGGSSSRHLHVVPNTANHIGDDATPVMTPVSTASTGNSNITNNFVINQQPGESAESLAAQIMDYIDRSQKSRNERY